MGYWMDRAKQLTDHDESPAPIPSESLAMSGPEGAATTKTTSPDPIPVVPPAPPIQPGWFVTYSDRQGRLCGGWEDRQKATVTHCLWSERGWSVHLSDGQAIRLTAVRCVGQTNEQGELKAAWSVREHGLDGTRNQA
jgi:hypothetical protein